MKKLLLFAAVAVFASLGVQAQSNLPNPFGPKLAWPESPAAVKKYSNGNKIVNRGPDDISQWYRYTRAFEQGVVFGNLDYSASFMGWDSNSYWIFHDNRKLNIATHLIGSTLDCKDSIWSDANNAIVTRYNPLTIDSLAFFRFYIRNLDSVVKNNEKVEVVDTMIIQCFLAPNMEFGTLVGADPVFFGYPNRTTMNQTTMINSGAVKTIKIPLRGVDRDTVNYNGAQTTFTSTIQELPIGITTGSSNTNFFSNLFSWTLVFKPMVPVPLGDTVMSINGSFPHRKYNLLGYRQGDKDGFNQSRTNFSRQRLNTSTYTFKWLRYGQTQNGWNKYINSAAYNTSFFVDNFIKVSTTNLSTKTKAVISDARIFPNPANGTSGATLVYNTKSLENVVVSVADVNGKVINTFNSKSTKLGMNTVNINTMGLTKGLYFVTVQSENGMATAKLSVQ